MKKRNIGVLGLSANPVTKFHIRIAELVLKMKLVDKVWLLPNYQHNLGKDLIDPLHRIEMLYRSIKGRKNIDLCLYEIEGKTDGKLYETLYDLSAIYSDFHYNVIVGMDCALDIEEKWYKGKELIKQYPFIIVKRIGYDYDVGCNWFENKPHKIIKDRTSIEYSSTIARNAIKNNDNNLQEQQMFRSVIDYIKNNQLYLN